MLVVVPGCRRLALDLTMRDVYPTFPGHRPWGNGLGLAASTRPCCPTPREMEITPVSPRNVLLHCGVSKLQRPPKSDATSIPGADRCRPLREDPTPIRALLPCSARAISKQPIDSLPQFSSQRPPGTWEAWAVWDYPMLTIGRVIDYCVNCRFLAASRSDGSSKRPMKLPACVTRSSSLPHCCPAW